jgi:hypothetical protein
LECTQSTTQGSSCSRRLNNLALAFIVAGFLAPVVSGQLSGRSLALVTLAWIGLGIGLHSIAQAALGGTAMTWDQAVTWLIIPAIVAIVIGGGGLWLSRHIP